MARKLDYRVMLTQKMFKAAFLQLIKDKAINDITIRELCAVAGVNRGTFYSHYEDIYDLLRQIEDEMYEKLTNTVSEYLLEDHNVKQFYYELFRFFHDNSEMCIMLFGKNSDYNFVNKLLDYGQKIFMKTYVDSLQDADVPKMVMCYNFISGGCIRILRLWMAGGMKESVETMGENFYDMVENGIKFGKTSEKAN